MRKFILLFLAALGLWTFTSCQVEDYGSGKLKGEVELSINAGIQGDITTYADADGAFSHLGGINNVSGEYALRFILEVYDQEKLAYREVKYLDDFSRPQVTFSPRLLAKEYKFAFWADFVEKGASEQERTDLYYRTDALSEIEYTQAVKDDPGILTTDLADAYFACTDVDLRESGQSLQVTLNRPFGKIRLLATDTPDNQVEEGEKAPTSATIVFDDANVPTTFNVLTGEASEATLPVSGYTFAAIKENAPVVKGYTGENAIEYAYLLGQTYFFTSPEASAYKMTVTVHNNDTQIGYRELTNIPVSANRLTTVIGNFYTNEGSIEVIVEDQFGNGEEVINGSKWSGASESPVIDEENKTIAVNSAEQLAGLAELVNGGNSYEGYTATLNCSIDLGNVEWTPVGTGSRFGSIPVGKSFKGTFDGNGQTISNLSINVDPENPDQAIGLFGIIDGGTVKNLIFKDVDINVPSSEMAAAAVGMLTGGGTVSGIEVLSGSVIAKRGNGAVVGRLIKSGTIEKCVNGAAVSGTGANVGGIVGAAYYTEEGASMTIRDCENNGTVTGTAGVVGGIAGLSAADVVNCTNNADITGNGADVAGIVAEQQNAGSVKGCVNNGDVINSSASYGTGGIVGWIRYNGSTGNYPVKNVIEVSGNTNYGSVQGGNDAGGIVGTVYNLGIIEDNYNYAETLSAKTFAAGIAGNAQFTETAIGMTESNMVYVRNNFSSTPLDKITVEGSCKALFVYINNGDYVTESNNTLLITDAAQFRSFASLVNNGNAFAGKNVALGADIDLNNELWIPIGKSGKPFQGNFDGRGYTISNLKAGTSSQNDVGLFGFTSNGTVKNIKIHNAEIKGNLDVAVVAGTPYTTKYSNISVTGLVKVDGFSYIGGIFGKNVYANVSDLTIDCEEGSYVKGYSVENGTAYNTYIGGVIGFMGEGSHKVSNVESNIDVIGSTAGVGGISGNIHYNNTFENCHCTGNVTLEKAEFEGDQYFIGGIAGIWVDTQGVSTFTDCSFDGVLSSHLFDQDVSSEIAESNRIVGGRWSNGSSSATGKLVIDGVEVDK